MNFRDISVEKWKSIVGSSLVLNSSWFSCALSWYSSSLYSDFFPQSKDMLITKYKVLDHTKTDFKEMLFFL